MNHATPPPQRVLEHLREIADDAALEVELVALAAGDREPSAAQAQRLAREREARGPGFTAALLFALTHSYYSYDEADALWAGILQHKQQLTEALGRNPGVAVAALDYLTNIRRRIQESTIIAEEKLETIADIAVRDRLTRLFDRATFESVLRHELRRYRRYGGMLSLVMLDVDDFKRINDEHGHLRGDEVLRRLGALLAECIRDVDVAGRYGGEEFLVVLPQTGPREAAQIAERLRTSVAADFLHAEPPVTVSLGVASCPQHGSDRSSLLRAVDEALYRAKARGKDCVELATAA